jgi:hypothetical protein
MPNAYVWFVSPNLGLYADNKTTQPRLVKTHSWGVRPTKRLMIPFIHKFKVISRIALISRYGARTSLQQHTRPMAFGLQDHRTKEFHTSSSAKMAQLSDEPVVDVMQKLQNHPEAMVAVTKFLQVAHKEGTHCSQSSMWIPYIHTLFDNRIR